MYWRVGVWIKVLEFGYRSRFVEVILVSIVVLALIFNSHF